MTDTHPLPPDEATLRDLLRQVIDPEAGVNIVDLGLVYRVEAGPQRVLIDVTMTSPACPLGEMIMDQIRDALEPALPTGLTPEIRLVWEPPWQPSMMSEGARRQLGW